MSRRRDQPRWLRKVQVRTRRALHRLDRSAPAWIAWLPSWGSSLLIHAVVLVILATAYFVANPSTAPAVDPDATITALADEDLRSLVEANQTGDPFTTMQSHEAPSLSLEAAPTSSVTAQPNLSGAKFAPSLALPERAAVSRTETAASDLLRTIRVHVEDMTAPFAGRSEATRAQILRREGGTAASERAVSEGLYWLSRHQADDGGWHLDCREECRESPGCPPDAHAVSDTAATGLALLPFLGAGHTHTQPGKYRDTIRRGLDWLIAHQQKNGELFLGGLGNSQMYSHAIASMALCEAYGLSHDERLRGPAQLAINFILMAQNKDDGGWRYYPGMPGDTSVLGWQMFALRSARLSGLEIPKNALRGCSHFLDLVSTDKYRTRYSYMPGRDETVTMSAEALLCRQYLGWQRDSASMARGAAGVWDDLQASNERNIYYWYYATQLLHNMQNKAWKQWNARIRDGLVAQQVSGVGCDRGSWSPLQPVPDRWGARVGRLYQTSLSVLTLEVYYRFLPLYRTDNAEAPKPEKPSSPETPEANPG